LWIWKDTTEEIIKEINYEDGVNIGHFAFYYLNGNIKTKGQGFREGGNDYISMKDTLYFYNENENEKIDSIEIYEGGRLKEKIKKEN
jgi:antitoxin component YwqK of YwqJK toxin-antitoxin module